MDRCCSLGSVLLLVDSRWTRVFQVARIFSVLKGDDRTEGIGRVWADPDKIEMTYFWSLKPTYFKTHGHEVFNPALDDDFTLAVKTAQAKFDQHQPQVVVGSSRGGAVAMNINSGDAKLVLLCPGWKKFAPASTAKLGTVILHSRVDDVVPFADSEELVKNSGLPKSALIEVGNDHRLADSEPLDAMLSACELDMPKAGCDNLGSCRAIRACGTRSGSKADSFNRMFLHGCGKLYFYRK